MTHFHVFWFPWKRVIKEADFLFSRGLSSQKKVFRTPLKFIFDENIFSVVKFQLNYGKPCLQKNMVIDIEN